MPVCGVFVFAIVRVCECVHVVYVCVHVSEDGNTVSANEEVRIRTGMSCSRGSGTSASKKGEKPTPGVL